MTHSLDYFAEAINCGAVTVNKKTIGVDYLVGAKDTVYHTIHLHEPTQIPIIVICNHNDYVVVNKPPGIACHPTSHYNFFTVTKILEPLYGVLSCVNRLDIPTSGVLILVKTNLKYYHELMKNREIKKTYIAKVKGNIENQTIDARIESIPGKGCRVSENGRECKTIIKNILYKNGYSLVECKPLTGRTHQIRVHLSSIGYPIVNDKMYGGETIADSTLEDKQQDYKGKSNKIETTKTSCDGLVTNLNEIESIFTVENKIEIKALDFILRTCEQENSKPYKNNNQFICLHASEYKIDDQVYKADWPGWAKW
ncbi:DRAP deaminase [Binucleata daphniae]